MACSSSSSSSLYCTVEHGNLLRRSGGYLLWKLLRERSRVFVATVNASRWHFGRFLCLSCEVFNYSCGCLEGELGASSPLQVMMTKAFQSDKPLPVITLIITFFSGEKFSSRHDFVASAPICRSDTHHPLLLSQAILDVVVNLQFSLIEKLWQTFWRYSPPDSVEGATVTENR